VKTVTKVLPTFSNASLSLEKISKNWIKNWGAGFWKQKGENWNGKKVEIAIKKIDNLASALKKENKPTVTEDQLPCLQKDNAEVARRATQHDCPPDSGKSALDEIEDRKKKIQSVFMDFLNLQNKIQELKIARVLHAPQAPPYT
jgi:uncharacterized protein YdaU (DUF1376 family)